MEKAALYIRVSTGHQVEEGFSMEAQHDILMDLLEKKGLQLYRVYSDPGVSGGSFKRPGIQMLIADMKAKRFDTLLIHKLDRLSRNQGDLYNFIDLINKLDVRLIIAAQGSEEIDTRSPMGKAFLMFSGLWAEIYLDNLREETLKGLTKKAKLGGRHMSKPPLGYDFDDEYNLVINEEEAKLVREVYRLYLKGWGVTRLAKHMNTFSRKKEGGLWDSKGIRSIVTNPTYAGYNHFKPDHWDDDKRIVTEGDHEPIISAEDYRTAQVYIKRRSNSHMSKRTFEYPYSGIVKCGLCGANYTGNATVSRGREYRSYRCYQNYSKNTCSAPGLSEKILNELVFKEIQEIDPVIKPKKTEKEDISIQKEVEKSNKRRKNWQIALGDGKLSPDDYAELIEEEDQRMKHIYDKLEEKANQHIPEIPIDELKKMVMRIREDWDILDAEDQKLFIQSMFKEIVILKKGDKWTIQKILTI